jgi:hypothetical protein
MAICPHQAFDREQESAAGLVALVSRRCQAAQGLARLVVRQQAFDLVAARFHPVVTDQPLGTCRAL